uniref:Uncharacterized protein n=1 Tax=Zea mays TaxID=4577 RepID=C4J7J3_MAIZE|nr:unknown [Zea mays]
MEDDESRMTKTGMETFFGSCVLMLCTSRLP